MQAIIIGIFVISIFAYLCKNQYDKYGSADFGFPTWQDINRPGGKYIPLTSQSPSTRPLRSPYDPYGLYAQDHPYDSRRPVQAPHYFPANEWGNRNPFLQRPLLYHYPTDSIVNSPNVDCYLAPSSGRCSTGFRKIGARCCKRNDLDLYEP